MDDLNYGGTFVLTTLSLSVLTLDLMKLGYRRPLERNDIWLINPSRSTHKLAANLKMSFQEQQAKGKKNPLLIALFQTLKFEFILGALAAFVYSMVQVMVPFVLKYIIYFANDCWYARRFGTPAPNIGRGVGLVICLTVMQIIGSIGQNHFFYRGMIFGGQARSALISIIFDKAMTISGRAKAGGKVLQSPPAGIKPGSEEEKKHFKAEVEAKAEKHDGKKKKGKDGKVENVESENEDGWRNSRIVNLMSVDTYRIDQACGWLHMIWGNPVSLAVTIVLLTINLTYSAVPGIALFFIATPLVAFVTTRMFRRRGGINKLTDQRVSVTQEVLQSIRFIKYYAWEADFMKRLADLRESEIGSIRRLLGTRQVINAFGVVLPVFAAMLAFITFSLSGHALNPAPVFSSLALFNQMRMQLVMLPVIIGMVSDAYQSIHRIEDFLLSEDTTDTTTLLEHGDFTIEVKGASFTWEESERPDPEERLPMTDIALGMGGRGGRGGRGGEGKQPDSRKAAKEREKAIKAGKDIPPETENEKPRQALQRPPFTINDINLQVGSSELIAIVGEVGSGKSSFLSAIGKSSSLYIFFCRLFSVVICFLYHSFSILMK
jgi:ATP-binding cassette subfamily C (CFTR/MRP) protein 1